MENFSPKCLDQWAGAPNVEMHACIWTATEAIGMISGKGLGKLGRDQIPARENLVVCFQCHYILGRWLGSLPDLCPVFGVQLETHISLPLSCIGYGCMRWWSKSWAYRLEMKPSACGSFLHVHSKSGIAGRDVFLQRQKNASFGDSGKRQNLGCYGICRGSGMI